MKRKLCFLELLCPLHKVIGLFIICLIYNTRVYPQGTLSIGDKLPEVTVSNILNHPTGSSKLSSYRGKLLILDFMVTWCSLCSSLVPKTDSLQKSFGKEVQFLPVTYQSKADVEKLLTRLKTRGVKISLPVVVSDTLLHSFFPHHYVPHYVWIDASGVIQAITGYQDVTKENIRKVLNKQPLSFRTKVDAHVPYNHNDFLLAGNETIPSKNILYQSAFTNYIEGLPSSFTIFPIDSIKGHRIVSTNSRIPTLYRIAYGSLQGKFFNDNQIALEMKDTTCCTSILESGAYREWLSGHSYGYELIVPVSMLGQQARIMQQDLARVFPQYQASVEKRSFRCLALVRTSDKDNLATRGGESKLEVNPFGVQLQNQWLINLIYQLNAKYLAHLSIPVVDETGYKKRIDLSLDANMNDVSSIRKALKKYNLDLIETKRELEVLVIRDSESKRKP